MREQPCLADISLSVSDHRNAMKYKLHRTGVIYLTALLSMKTIARGGGYYMTQIRETTPLCSFAPVFRH